MVRSSYPVVTCRNRRNPVVTRRKGQYRGASITLRHLRRYDTTTVLLTNPDKVMQTINITPTASILDENKPPRLILLKGIAIATITVSLIGGIIHVVNSRQTITKSSAQQQPKPDISNQKLITPTQPLEPPKVVVKKPEKPIVIEEGSDAWFCLQNNGGSGCLERDRFAPNFKIVSPPKPQKTYPDYSLQYGIRELGDCGRYFNGRPNC